MIKGIPSNLLGESMDSHIYTSEETVNKKIMPSLLTLEKKYIIINFVIKKHSFLLSLFNLLNGGFRS